MRIPFEFYYTEVTIIIRHKNITYKLYIFKYFLALIKIFLLRSLNQIDLADLCVSSGAFRINLANSIYCKTNKPLLHHKRTLLTSDLLTSLLILYISAQLLNYKLFHRNKPYFHSMNFLKKFRNPSICLIIQFLFTELLLWKFDYPYIDFEQLSFLKIEISPILYRTLINNKLTTTIYKDFA